MGGLTVTSGVVVYDAAVGDDHLNGASSFAVGFTGGFPLSLVSIGYAKRFYKSSG